MSTEIRLPAGRYTPVETPRRKQLRIAGFAIGAAAVIAVVVWFAIGSIKTPVWYQEVGFKVVSSEMIEVTFDLTKDADATVNCAVQALNESKAEVGVTEVEIGPRPQRSTRQQVTVHTSELATTGIIKQCRVISE